MEVLARAGKLQPQRQRRGGVTRRTPPNGISPQRGAFLKPTNHSAGGFVLVLRRLSPPSRKISEFSTRRSAMAVAMVVLKRMLPQSENVVLVVIMVLRLRLCRVEMTW